MDNVLIEKQIRFLVQRSNFFSCLLIFLPFIVFPALSFYFGKWTPLLGIIFVWIGAFLSATGLHILVAFVMVILWFTTSFSIPYIYNILFFAYFFGAYFFVLYMSCKEAAAKLLKNSIS